MSWQIQEREAVQKFLRESILQLCRLNIGICGNFEVDGIICISRGRCSGIKGNVDEEQIVVKVHEQITTTARDSSCPQRQDVSILRQYLSNRGVISKLINQPTDVVVSPVNLKRKANDENDNAIVEFVGYSGVRDRNFMLNANVKSLRYDEQKPSNSKAGHHHGVLLHSTPSGTEIQPGCTVPSSSRDHDRSKLLFSCGSCLLDFDSLQSLRGHFQQMHTSCLEHYCGSCTVGFLSATDLTKHNISVHGGKPGIMAAGSRRKQSRPKRGVAVTDDTAVGNDSEDEVANFMTATEYPPERGTIEGSTPPVTLKSTSLLENMVTKMLPRADVVVAKSEEIDDTGIAATALEHGCPHCESSFVDFQTFTVHCQSVHHRFPCPHCLQTFSQRVNRDRHVYNHTGEKPFECAVCGCGFTRRDALKKHHLKTGHAAEGATFSTSINATSTPSSLSGNESQDDVVPNDEYVNEKCGLDLSVPSRTVKTDSPQPESGFQETTGNTTESQSVVKPEPFQPVHSPSSIIRNSPVAIASREGSGIEALLRAQRGEADDGASVIRRPVPDRLLMNNSRLYSCDICHAVVDGAAAFEVHCRNEHRRTPCVYCGKTFSQKGNMERHQRQHTGERPFACPHCSCSYTRKETLKVHINQAHPTAVASDAEVVAQ